jgi:hypothetical protein
VGWDEGFSVAVDSSGSAYVCGVTSSPDFPVTPNALQPVYGGTGVHGVDGINNMGDGFVIKLDPMGSTLLYSTFLGGTGDEVATDIVVDDAGQAYVTGVTFSQNFPTGGTPFQAELHGVSDAFVAKLNADGSALVYSTFLGGSNRENVESINYDKRGIAIDSGGNAYVTGETFSSDFPVINALQASNPGNPSPFLSKLAPDGSTLVYSTYLGGCDTRAPCHRG